MEETQLLELRKVNGQMKRQQEIAGTEPKGQDPDIEDALYAWFEAKDEQKRAGEATRVKHASLLQLVKESGRQFYPYLDPKTGKKRRIRIQETPKVVTERDVSRKAADVEVGDEANAEERAEQKRAKKAEEDANAVESRRVSRKSVEKEIGSSDPFAATRAAMETTETEHT